MRTSHNGGPSVQQFLHCEGQQEAVLKATAVPSPLPVMSSILPCPPCLPPVILSVGEGGGPAAGGVGHRGVG